MLNLKARVLKRPMKKTQDIILHDMGSSMSWAEKISRQDIGNPEIDAQKALAKKYLDRLAVLDPNIAVCGGAPRDWFLGAKANDIDFYLRSFNTNKFNNPTEHARRLSDLLHLPVTHKTTGKAMTMAGKFVPNKRCKNNGGFYKMPCLQDVYAFKDGTQEFDIIYISSKVVPMDVIDQFDSSICKIAWIPYNYMGFLTSNGPITPSDDYHYAPSFEKTLLTKKITYGKDVEAKGKHAAKLLAKFPHFRHYVGGKRIDTPPKEKKRKYPDDGIPF
jgi:hypothetical protein